MGNSKNNPTSVFTGTSMVTEIYVQIKQRSTKQVNNQVKFFGCSKTQCYIKPSINQSQVHYSMNKPLLGENPDNILVQINVFR